MERPVTSANHACQENHTLTKMISCSARSAIPAWKVRKLSIHAMKERMFSVENHVSTPTGTVLINGIYLFSRQ